MDTYTHTRHTYVYTHIYIHIHTHTQSNYIEAMDSKRDIRPKLASRLLKDSLVLHCLFRVSLVTQHIIGTIIFLKQRKNENKNNVLRIYARSASVTRRNVCACSPRVCGDTLVHHLTALRSSPVVFFELD